jgi:TolA-binding protein
MVFSMTFFEPRPFGKYLLLDKLAVGGMAELYLAKMIGIEGFEKLIALKKLLPHLTSEKELVDAFVDEAKLAAMLSHENIVHIYDFGRLQDSYYIAMEYLYGKDLWVVDNESKAKDCLLSLDYILYLTSRICAGLEYAHNLKDFRGQPLNLIHRDVSPQNVFITYEGGVKIVDFGIAKAATQSTKTQVGMIKGKVAYMSPEQADGQPIDKRSDIFSTGILMYEMVTGKRMFEGDTLQILAKVRAATFDPPERVTEDLPNKVYAIIHKALSKDRDRRYASCSEMLGDLESCMSELDVHPTAQGLAKYMKALFGKEMMEEERKIRYAAETNGSVGKPRKIGDDQSLPELGEMTGSAGSDPSDKGKRRKVLSAGLIAVLAAIGLTFLLWSGKGPERETDHMVPRPDRESMAPDVEEKETLQPVPTEQSAMAPIAAERVPDPSPTVKAESEGAHYNFTAAMAALEQRRFSEAVDLFEELVASDPSLREDIAAPYAKALSGKASSMLETSPQEAADLLERAVALQPHSIEAHSQLGLIHLNQKKYAKAIDVYQKVVELDPRFSDAYFNLGYMYAVKREYPEAEKMYARVVALKPSYVDEALFNLAMVQEKQGKSAECIVNLEEALRINPQNALAAKYLDKLKREKGKKP